MLLGGVRVGENSVVAARFARLVTRNVPANMLVGGKPEREVVIRSSLTESPSCVRCSGCVATSS